MIQELDQVVLMTDLIDDGLESGDIGTVVLVHQGGKGYEVEFISLSGETIAVVTVFANQVRPTGKFEIAHARSITAIAA